MRPFAWDSGQPEQTPLPPRALRASWELLLPPYTDALALERAMEAALRSLPEGLV